MGYASQKSTEVFMLNKQQRLDMIMDSMLYKMSLQSINAKTISKAVTLVCSFLEIESPKVVLSTETKTGCYIPETKEFHIARTFCNYDTIEEFERIMEIIAHELRHKYQYDTGMFSLDDPYLTVEEHGYEAYRNQPIEKDAFEFGESMREDLAAVLLDMFEEEYVERADRRRAEERATTRRERSRRR
jgi:hypothetical protein